MKKTKIYDEQKLKKAAVYASISLAVILSGLKIIGAFYTGSLSILSSVVDSLSDILASVITFFAIKISSLPASSKHRYGYGKIESLSALFQSAFIAGSGLFILYDAINRLLHPQKLEATGIGLGIMIFSLISSLGLVYFQKFVYKKTKSQAIIADSAHYSVDILTNLGIIITLIAVWFFKINWIDTIAGIIIAGILLYNAYNLAKDSIVNLLDKELSNSIRQKIKNIVMSHNFSKGIHDLRTRDLGNGYSFEFHLELDGSISLNQAHIYADSIEADIKKTYPNAQIIIHQEPYGLCEQRLDYQIKKTKKRG